MDLVIDSVETAALKWSPFTRSADRKLMSPLQCDRETQGYFDKIFQLCAQLAAAAKDLGVLSISLAYTHTSQNNFLQPN